MNVKYYSLYKESDSGSITYYIPLYESKESYSVVGFVYYGNWEFNDELVSPDDWEEVHQDDENYLKIIDINKTPKKQNLIRTLFET
ncbi:MAG: hypothetical protein ACOCP4_06175 [Candidatus Woesearchaeota archaeon]